MNTRNLPASALLVVIGAAMVLFIGAFTRFDPASSLHPPTAPAVSPLPVTQDDPPAEANAEPPLPANLSPGLAELIKLAQAHVDESVILAYVKNSREVFAPTADEILYLSDLGVSQDVIGAIVASAPPAAVPQPSPEVAAAPAPPLPPEATPAPALTSAAPPPAAANQPEADATAGAFYNELAPYGAWVQQPDYGLVWQPTVNTTNPNWSPYVDGGQWVYSDSGWYWQSDYAWGWAAFHYGRWANIPGQGWVWQPGNIWAPAWVAWRASSPHVGWAPLPPGVGLNVLAQLTYNSKPVGPNSTFGLPASAYTFVNISNLTSRNLPRRAVPAPRVKDLVRSSVTLDSYAIVNNRIFNGGANPEAVAAARHRPVPQFTLRSVSWPQDAGLEWDRKTLGVYVPSPGTSGASPARRSDDSAARSQANAERLPGSDQGTLAENNSTEAAAVVPSAANGSDVSVQLPPLHYSSSATPPPARRHIRQVNMAYAPDTMQAERDWPRGFAAPTVEQPSTPAPRFEGFNPPARQVESPRFAPENRPAVVENRPAPVESPRAAPAPSASSSSSGSGKSGK